MGKGQDDKREAVVKGSLELLNGCHLSTITNVSERCATL